MFNALGMTGEQLMETMAYDSIEPLGSYKLDFHFAHLCNLLVEIAQAAWGGKKRRLTKIKDYMPWWFTQHEDNVKSVVRRESWQSMMAKMKAMFGPRDKVRKGE